MARSRTGSPAMEHDSKSIEGRSRSWTYGQENFTAIPRQPCSRLQLRPGLRKQWTWFNSEFVADDSKWWTMRCYFGTCQVAPPDLVYILYDGLIQRCAGEISISDQRRKNSFKMFRSSVRIGDRTCWWSKPPRNVGGVRMARECRMT